MNKYVYSLSAEQCEQLYQGLHYLHMDELRSLADTFQLATKGTKKQLINRLFARVKGTLPPKEPVIPSVSCAKKGGQYPVAPDTLMLYGAYKNSHEQRALFKQLVGDHFHFTAYGVDWLKEQWAAGKPPTYQQFADYWQNQYVERSTGASESKEEWAYIKFLQEYSLLHSDATAYEMKQAWHVQRSAQKDIVWQLLHLK